MRAALEEHEVMLVHMAETWERIARDIDAKNGRRS